MCNWVFFLKQCIYPSVDSCVFGLLFQTIKQNNKERYRQFLEMLSINPITFY